MITRGTALAMVGGALVGAIAGLMTHGAAADSHGSKPDFEPFLSAPPSVAAGLPAASGALQPARAATPSAEAPESAALVASAGAAAGTTAAPSASALLPGAGENPPSTTPGPDVASRSTPSSATASDAVDFPGWAPLTSPPSNKAELTRILEQCGQRDGSACLASGIAYEKGFGTSVNSAEADRFKRIALSYLARFCERRDPGACIVLAGMYRRGLVVAQSLSQAESLEQRSRELCHVHNTPACAKLDAQ